jgi:hypothetical protein
MSFSNTYEEDSSSDSNKSTDTIATNNTASPIKIKPQRISLIAPVLPNNNKQQTIITHTVPTKRPDPEGLNLFSLHIYARPQKGQPTPEIHEVVQQVLEALQKADPSTKLLSVPDKTTQSITLRSLYINKTNEVVPQHPRFLSDIALNNKGTISGNVWYTGNSRFSTMKKSNTFRQHLRVNHHIFLTLNNISAKVPIEIGFFIHKLSRHDTVEHKEYIASKLPTNSPPFQPEQAQIWAGPTDKRKTATVIKISTRQQDVTIMTKLFEDTFNNPDHMTFIRQTYFNCLTPNAKLQYVESQSAYATKHRTYLLHGLLNINILTKNTDKNNKQLSIKQWI